MGTPTVLIIDDERTLVESLAYGLKKRDFNPVSAFTGSEGLAKAQETAPDVVLLDMRMPGIDGLEVIRRMKLDERLSRVPVIVTSAPALTNAPAIPSPMPLEPPVTSTRVPV